jgi:tetratricopeptide (TPR) repeat protein
MFRRSCRGQGSASRSRLHPLLWALTALGLPMLGCTGHWLSVPRDPRAAAVALVHGGKDPEIDRLVASVYGHALAPARARAEAEQVLAKYPSSGAAHEVAGYLAQLADEPHEAWLHFWRAAQDLDAPMTELYLWELDNDSTRGELDRNLALYAALRAAHPAPTTRAAAAFAEAALLRRLGRRGEAPALVATLGFITDWAILGAFDNEAGKGFLTEYAPEKKLALDEEVPGPLLPLRWRTLAGTSALGTVEIGYAVEPQDPGVAYLATWIRSDDSRLAQLRVSSPHPTRAWLNGTIVLSEEQVEGAELDNLIVPVSLHAGWNQLLIKSAQKDGWWWLRARLTDPAGARLLGISTSAQPRKYERQAAATEPSEPSQPILAEAPALAAISPPNRRHFLTGRWLARGGHLHAEQTALQAFLDDAPDNLLAVHGLALAYVANGEAGKGIDLLNRGVARGGRDAVAFLRLRGLYYQQRGLYDKAQADFLSDIDANPRARAAELALAELFGQRGWKAERCRQLESTSRKWPDSAMALRNLGGCELELGYPARGERTLERALAQEPGATPTLRRLYTHALDEGRFSEARGWLRELREIAPGAPGYLADAGELSRREGQTAGAEASWREAMALNPLWAWPHQALGDLFLEHGRTGEAVAEWKLAHAREPNDTVLSQRIEFYEPTRLGFIESYIPTAETIDRALSRKLTPAPGAQIAMLLDDEVTEVNADGSARRFVTEVRQALNEQGRDSLISERLPGTGTLKILQAYSLSRAGERQEASSIRGSEIRFRNLEVGSRVVMQFVHYAPAQHFLENQYISTWFFRTPGNQHEESRWVLVLPKERPLKIDMNGPIETRDEVKGTRRVRIFAVTHAPALVPEPHGPPIVDLLWRVSVSTVPDWDDYVRWERALLAEAFRSSPRLDALAARLVKGADTPREKLDRLYEYVTKEIRYQQDYESSIAGVRPHACPVVLERGYGDCKDKAVLLIELAKLVGVKLKFAILRTTNAGRVLPEVPNQQFNHAIVYVPVQPGFAEASFMDPTSDGLDLGNLPAVDQGARSLVLDPDSGAWSMVAIPFQAADVNYARYSFRVRIASPARATAEGEMTARGSMAGAMRHVLRNAAYADQVLQSMAASLFPGGTLTSSSRPTSEDTRAPVTLRLEVDASHSIQNQGSGFRFVLAPGSQDIESMVTLDSRATPLHLGIPAESTRSISVTVPEGYSVDHVPPDFAVSNPCLTLSRRSVVRAGTVTVVVQTRYTCSEIAVADYAAFRDGAREGISRLRDDIGFSATRPKETTAVREVVRRAAAASAAQ